MKENKKPDNPHAFAMEYCNEQSNLSQEEMTLRNYFANSAMQGICADSHTFWDNPTIQGNPYNIAKLSFDIADEMLKQREL